MPGYPSACEGGPHGGGGWLVGSLELDRSRMALKQVDAMVIAHNVKVFTMATDGSQRLSFEFSFLAQKTRACQAVGVPDQGGLSYRQTPAFALAFTVAWNWHSGGEP